MNAQLAKALLQKKSKQWGGGGVGGSGNSPMEILHMWHPWKARPMEILYEFFTSQLSSYSAIASFSYPG